MNIDQIGSGKNLQFTCEVFVKPDVTLGEYKGVAVPREHTLVTDEQVEAMDRRGAQKAGGRGLRG